MERKAFNPQVFIEFICYIIFSILILHLVVSNQYLSYVTPRMKPYLIITSIIMLIWACYGLRRLFRPQHRIRVAHCLVLLLPSLLIILPHKPISASDLTSGYVSLNSLNKTSDGSGSNKLSTLPTQDPLENKSSTIQATPTVQEEIDNDSLNLSPDYNLDTNSNNNQNMLEDEELGLKLSGLDAKNRSITISDEEFYPWLIEIFTNMKQYEGYQVTIKGFVFRDDPELEENEFVASRLLMSCCTSDLVPCGIVCQYDQTSELTAEEWITVEGVIHIGEYMGNEEPQITVNNIMAAEKPEDEYIYPY